jgi:hypothetical protein
LALKKPDPAEMGSGRIPGRHAVLPVILLDERLQKPLALIRFRSCNKPGPPQPGNVAGDIEVGEPACRLHEDGNIQNGRGLDDLPTTGFLLKAGCVFHVYPSIIFSWVYEILYASDDFTSIWPFDLLLFYDMISLIQGSCG